MNLDGHALADPVFVDARAERHHRAHIFVPGSEVLVVRHAAKDQRRRPVIDDLEIGRADRDRVDAHQHLGLLRHRHRLVPQQQLAGIAEHPCLHGVGNGIIRARFYSSWRVHRVPFDACSRASTVSRARNGGRNRSGSRLVYVSSIFEGYNHRTPALTRRERETGDKWPITQSRPLRSAIAASASCAAGRGLRCSSFMAAAAWESGSRAWRGWRKSSTSSLPSIPASVPPIRRHGWIPSAIWRISISTSSTSSTSPASISSGVRSAAGSPRRWWCATRPAWPRSRSSEPPESISRTWRRWIPS